MAEQTRGGRILSAQEVSSFCAQLAMIIKAGISASEGVQILREDAQNQEAKEIYGQLLEPLSEGRPLWFALKECGRFPSYVVEMVEIGETSGRLDEVLDSLCAYYENNEAISKSIRNAVTYPLMMIVMMGVVIALLVAKVLPIFQQVFRQLGSEMSAVLQGVIHTGTILTNVALVAIVLILLAVVLVAVLQKSEPGREKLHRFFGALPLTRRFTEQAAASRFASAMALMLGSGLDIDQSVEMAGHLMEDPAARAKITVLRDQMAEGKGFADALGESGLFSGVNARLVKVGFRTGSVDGVMARIASRYEEDLDESIGRILSVLEPTLVALLSIVVGVILLSVMLPLMGIMSSIG